MRIISSCVAAATLILGGAAGGWALGPDPTPADMPAQLASAEAPPALHIEDPHSLIPRDRVVENFSRIEFPAAVRDVTYLVFATNASNINDTVEDYVRDHRPELIAPDDDHFADGSIILGIGFDPRKVFAFAGEDVADAVRLDARLEDILDAMKPGAQERNIPAALFAGTQEMVSAPELRDRWLEGQHKDRLAATGLGVAGGLTLGGGLVGWSISQQKKLRRARRDRAYLARHFGDVGLRLDAIDLRANSLTSPLAHADLRAQWAALRDSFLKLSDVPHLTDSATDKQLLAAAAPLADARQTVQRMQRAEENIDKLYAMEHGDVTARLTELEALRVDVVSAQAEVSGSLRRRLADLEVRLDEASRAPSAPDFLDTYTRLLRDYRLLLDELKERHFSDVPAAEKLRTPALWDADYRPGYGVHDFVPFYLMATWHANNVSAHEQATSSSGTNTSFSSGFSGSGGSSSF